MAAETTALTTANRVEPTYSAREAAVLLGRSYSWLDQRVRKASCWTVPSCAVTDAGRLPAVHYPMLKDIAICCRDHHWFSWEKLKATLLDLAVASYRDTGEYKIPS